MSRKKASATQVVEATTEGAIVELTELDLLKGFKDLVAEGIGYMLGAKAVQSEASEKTEKERKAANSVRKDISTHLEEWIKKADITAYTENMEKLKAARKALSEAIKSF